MKKSYTKFPHLLALLLSLLFGLSACQDKCEVSHTYLTYEPVYVPLTTLRSSVGIKPPQALQKVGKIYYRFPYVFVNEVDKGVHIINNSNPRSPQKIAFLNIPGNKDIAVKGNVMYADSYIDLVAIDISNPEEVKLLKRIENVFPQYHYYSGDQTSILTKWDEKWVTQSSPTNNCDAIDPPINIMFMDFRGNALSFSTASQVKNFVNNNPGIGGSMARFTIVDKYLYTVDNADLQVFDIQQTTDPIAGEKVNIGWGIETIFPYQDKLFIGSNNGMFIYNNENPAKPTFLSRFDHAQACDPVVVEGDYAYVTLRSGNTCPRGDNQLDVVNIKNITNPTLVKSYQMENPHGLGISDNVLFICEGKYGLKVFDAKNPNNISDNLLQKMTNLHAYDVIPLGEILLLIGEDGLYQFNVQNPKDLKLLSKIPIVK
jgi:hypothetical protein